MTRININNNVYDVDYIDADEIVLWLREKFNENLPDLNMRLDMRPTQGLELDGNWNWDWCDNLTDSWILQIKDDNVACEFKLRFL
jgi:hypothetical protein